MTAFLYVEAPGHYDGDGCRFPTPGHLVRVCATGCGCRYGTNDPDRFDCGCNGPCTTADPDVWGDPDSDEAES